MPITKAKWVMIYHFSTDLWYDDEAAVTLVKKKASTVPSEPRMQAY